jgi:hypothetical protein
MNTELVRRAETFIQPVIPQPVINALKLARQDYPDAFIAGGYLRDLYNGVEPVDVDLFTFAQPKEDEVDIGVNASEHYKVNRIVMVASRNMPDLDDVQIVFLDSEAVWRGNHDEESRALVIEHRAKAVGMFALGAQQIFYDGDTVYVTEAFKHDVLNRVFTVTFCEDENEAGCIVGKWNSLRRRYPGWRLKVPGQFVKHFYFFYQPDDPIFFP